MKTIKILLVKPQTQPEIKEINNDLETLQKLVDGYIEAVQLTSSHTLICNEDGKLIGLPFNREVIIQNRIAHQIVGDFIVTKHNSEGDFISLTDNEVNNFTRIFSF